MTLTTLVSSQSWQTLEFATIFAFRISFDFCRRPSRSVNVYLLPHAIPSYCMLTKIKFHWYCLFFWSNIYCYSPLYRRQGAQSLFLLSLVAKNGKIINCRTLWGIGGHQMSKISTFLNLKQDSNKVYSSLVTLSKVERFAICQTVHCGTWKAHSRTLLIIWARKLIEELKISCRDDPEAMLWNKKVSVLFNPTVSSNAPI